MLQLPDRDGLLRGRVLDRNDLSGLVPAWEGLCARAVESNVYYAPRYALALTKNIDLDESLRFATVWRAEKLVAFLPFKRPRVGAACAWQTDYTFSCTPLLDRDCPLDAAMALIDLLRAVHAGEWIIPTVNIGGPACRAILEALTNENRPSRIVNWPAANSTKPARKPPLPRPHPPSPRRPNIPPIGWPFRIAISC